MTYELYINNRFIASCKTTHELFELLKKNQAQISYAEKAEGPAGEIIEKVYAFPEKGK